MGFQDEFDSKEEELGTELFEALDAHKLGVRKSLEILEDKLGATLDKVEKSQKDIQTLTNTIAKNEENIQSLVDTIVKNEKIIALAMERLEKQEGMIATITLAYTEMFSAVDMMIKTTLEGYTPEQQEEFLRQFESIRTAVLKSVQEASRSGLEGLDPETKETMEHMAAGSRASQQDK